MRWEVVIRLLTISVVSTMAAPAWSAITPSITASRTSSCVAPCAVFFDATATTWSRHSSDEAFLDLYYQWDFDDSGSGSWTISGKSKDSAFGPVAAHVYDNSGDYRVTLSVTDGVDESATTQVSVTVTNPNTIFATTDTICFSNDSDFTGCPGSATETTTSSFNTVVTAAAATKRLLLKRDDTFTTTSTSTFDVDGPGIMGAFGSGADPIISSTVSGVTLQVSPTPGQVTDWRFMDLEFIGPASGQSIAIQYESNTKQMLIYRVKMTGFSAGIFAHRDTMNPSGSTVPHDQFFVVDSDLKSGGDLLVSIIFVAAERLAVMGNFLRGNTTEHVVRVQLSRPGVFQHNQFIHPTDGHLLKLHAPPFTDPGCCSGYNENLIVSDNTFIGFEAWSFTIGPQDAFKDQRVRRAIIERNYFTTSGTGSEVQYSLYMFSTVSSVARNNIINQPNKWGFQTQGIGVAQVGVVVGPPDNNRVYNNTCHRSNGNIRCIHIEADPINTTVRNNLVWVPSAGASTVALIDESTEGVTASNNLKASSNPFITGTPAVVTDFALADGFSAAIDQGFDIPAIQIDFFLTPRLYDGDSDGGGEIDIGAHEFTSFGLRGGSISGGSLQ